MKITQLLVLLLSFGRPIIAYVQLVERQPQGVWPDWNLGEAFWKSLTILGGAGAGIVNLFQDPQDSDSAKTIPPPDTGTESDRQTVPDTPTAAPSSATSSPSEPVYKININNDQSTTPDPDTKLPAVLPSLDEKCGLLDVSLQIYKFFELSFQWMTLTITQTNMGTLRQMTHTVARPQINSFSPLAVLVLIRTKSSQRKPWPKIKPFEKHWML